MSETSAQTAAEIAVWQLEQAVDEVLRRWPVVSADTALMTDLHALSDSLLSKLTPKKEAA
jgi:hypothetical protein